MTRVLAADWSTDFIVVDGDASAAQGLAQVRASPRLWVVIEREGGRWRYVFTREEVLGSGFLSFAISRGDDLDVLPLRDALNLHETGSSRQLGDVAQAPSIPTTTSPSTGRLIEVIDGEVTRISDAPIGVAMDAPASGRIVTASPTDARIVTRPAGESISADVGRTFASKPAPESRESRVRDAAPAGLDLPQAAPSAPDLPQARPPTGGDEAVAGHEDAGTIPVHDEGTSPVRYPSLEPSGALRSGARIAFKVDLLREELEQTFGTVELGQQRADWKTLDVDARLQSPQIDFDAGGTGRLVVHRNAATQAAEISGVVKTGLAAGARVDVKVSFLLGTRSCGTWKQSFFVEADAGAQPSSPEPPAAGTVIPSVTLDVRAERPDLTVFIDYFPGSAPTQLHWRMISDWFPGRPALLDGAIDLGEAPATQARALFQEFATLPNGSHVSVLEGFGERLWDRAPQAFKDCYWALCTYHADRALTIQFISDEPDMPWEMMVPYRDGEAHGPLLLRHAVARWLDGQAGSLRNDLPDGSLLAMAPRYPSIATELPASQTTVDALVRDFAAQRVDGTHQALLSLLQTPPAERVAMLYFSGHGAFAAASSDLSQLRLEGGQSLRAIELGQKVKLGATYGTVVFLNACEVGGGGHVLGTIGGWAAALLACQFGAVIAPLWAIEEKAAAVATTELMQSILRDRMPLSEALRELRRKHGDSSPTFYSYLLYGDVTARIGTRK